MRFTSPGSRSATTSLDLPRLGLQVGWASDDRHAWASPTAIAGITVAVVLAISGMPPLSVHGPLHFVGLMDPLCGMTRGVVALVRADPVEALRYNPGSPLVLTGGIGAVVRGIYGRRVGRWLNLRWRPTVLSIALTGLAITLLEVNQQLHVARLAG